MTNVFLVGVHCFHVATEKLTGLGTREGFGKPYDNDRVDL